MPAPDEPPTGAAPRRRGPSAAGAIIGLLVGLLGFALVAQVRGNSADSQLASARTEDLVRILSDLDARQARLRQEISDLEESRRQLESGARGREAALSEAKRRAEELGILAGTLPAYGPGLMVRFDAGNEPVRAAAILDAVEELRGAGAEAMQIRGGNANPVRIVASTYFVDVDGALSAGGTRLSGPFVIEVIGEPQTMRSALDIPGGVVDALRQSAGKVSIEERESLTVSATHTGAPLRHARPTS